MISDTVEDDDEDLPDIDNIMHNRKRFRMAQDFWSIVSGQALTAQAVEEMKWEVEEIQDERPAISGTEYEIHWKPTWISKEKIDHNLQELVQGLGWKVKDIWGPIHDHYGLEWEETWLPAEELSISRSDQLP